jgi:hypothetical protein
LAHLVADVKTVAERAVVDDNVTAAESTVPFLLHNVIPRFLLRRVPVLRQARRGWIDPSRLKFQMWHTETLSVIPIRKFVYWT